MKYRWQETNYHSAAKWRKRGETKAARCNAGPFLLSFAVIRKIARSPRVICLGREPLTMTKSNRMLTNKNLDALGTFRYTGPIGFRDWWSREGI